MSLEQALAANTAALVALTAALAAGGVVTGASTGTAADADKTTTGKGTAGKGKTDSKPKGPTVEEMQAALNDVKEKFGAAEAKAIIESAGGVKKMAEIPEAKVKAVFDAAKAKMEAPEDTGSDEGDGL